ncbi:hypothetical protein D5F01_LYC13323 [Larimichthys crocea]|uniref:Uncharacterized protein n=1 Tax=Larimichthys crocea TaxID=215358 RepID=A0A6G0I733_LARCR|nr:hypothetical protein D5F01_LYC13323 [Larimichthys crocea]
MMDSDCNYLLYYNKKNDEKTKEEKPESRSCPHCSKYPIQRDPIRRTTTHNTPKECFSQAMTGRMVPYVEAFESTDRSAAFESQSFNRSETPLRYAKHGKIISLQGAIHLQDVSPNGTWLSEKAECSKSVLRLRLASLVCLQLPELNRIVLEQKNDDGLLHLANKWLSDKENMNDGIEVFGPFACDAVLAPVLGEILRSQWINERKDLGETSNELKLGWAQEFYDWKCVAKKESGSSVFARDRKCLIKRKAAHGNGIVICILDKMRWCGYTPWSAVQALRCSEGRVSAMSCLECKCRLLASCKCSGRIWPVFVNATRACYQLYKALALPVSPSLMYTLELLARAWRRVNPKALERFIPMSTGGFVKVSSDHYAKHLVGPVRTLSDLGLVNELERNLTLRALSEGVLPCFPGEGDSVPDRLMSSTVALTFAACGLRVFGEFDKRDDGESCDYLTVTSAGLLYFAACYVIVYVASVHMQPVLKDKLSRTGSNADKHICSSLRREWEAEGSAPNYEFAGRRGTQALGIVFKDLLETRTVLRVVELYVPVLLAQLPYAKKLNCIPGSVKTAIESRDVWFVRQHGEHNPQLEGDEPPFIYLGNLAHGLHSSIEGTLKRSYTRPIAQALRRTDGEFDPWCDTLYVLTEAHDDDDDDDDVDVEDIPRLSLQLDSDETFYSPDGFDQGRPQRENRPSTGADSYTPEAPKQVLYGPDREFDPRCATPHVLNEDRDDDDDDDDVYVEDISRLSLQLDSDEIFLDYAPEVSQHPEAIEYCRICKGLLVNVHKLGFDADNGFLTNVDTLDKAKDSGRRGMSAPVVKTPCMTNIASTRYTKTRREMEVKDLYLTPSCGTLIEALWVLFMHSAVREEPSSTASVSATEPATPEALAVMRSWEAMNGELNVDGYHYYIFNKDYCGMRAPGSLCYSEGVWRVIVEGVGRLAVRVPHEKSTVHCYHDGTLGAYVRLNDLKVVKVPSDSYCGFHTVAVLLGFTKGSDECARDLRERLVLETSIYMTQHKQTEGIRTYLEFHEIKRQRDLTTLLMTPNRWLSVEEVAFILEAYGKPSAVITENSYPIYTATCCHFLIKACHYEPVMSIML